LPFGLIALATLALTERHESGSETGH